MTSTQQGDKGRAAAPADLSRSLAFVSQALADNVTDKRLAVLRGVATTGSISEAARQVGVSYKSAWQAIETLTHLAGMTLVKKIVGGAGGGGARLTAAGTRLLQAGAQWQTLQQAWFKQIGQPPHSPTLSGFAGLRLGMQTSMRNQWPVTVQRCDVSQARARVECRLPDGQQFWAQITPESQQLLGLLPGLSVLAMCKASAIRVRPEKKRSKHLPDNCFRAQVRASEDPGAFSDINKPRGSAVSVVVSSDVCLVGYWYDGTTVPVGDWVLVDVDPMAVVLAREMGSV